MHGHQIRNGQHAHKLLELRAMLHGVRKLVSSGKTSTVETSLASRITTLLEQWVEELQNIPYEAHEKHYNHGSTSK